MTLKERLEEIRKELVELTGTTVNVEVWLHAHENKRTLEETEELINTTEVTHGFPVPTDLAKSLCFETEWDKGQVTLFACYEEEGAKVETV